MRIKKVKINNFCSIKNKKFYTSGYNTQFLKVELLQSICEMRDFIRTQK